MNKQQRTRTLATAAVGMALGVVSVLGATAVTASAGDAVTAATGVQPVACGQGPSQPEKPLRTLWSGRAAYSAE